MLIKYTGKYVKIYFIMKITCIYIYIYIFFFFCLGEKCSPLKEKEKLTCKVCH